MNQCESSGRITIGYVRVILRARVLRLLTARLSLSIVLSAALFIVSSAVYAEDETLDAANELSQSIEISARGAPLSVFLQALLANTKLEFELSEHLEGNVTGDYAGSIASVLKTLSAEFNLTTRTQDGIVSVFPQIQRTTRSITALIQPTETEFPKLTDRPSEKPLEKPIEKSIEKAIEKNQLAQNEIDIRVEHDAVVERVFVLAHASAIDTQADDTNRSVVPGVLTQLKQLIEKLGISDMTNVGTPVGDAQGVTRSLIALPSMNAIAVKDLASRMDLYKDLIESLDMSSNRGKTNRRETSYSSVATHESSSKWRIVQ